MTGMKDAVAATPDVRAQMIKTVAAALGRKWSIVAVEIIEEHEAPEVVDAVLAAGAESGWVMPWMAPAGVFDVPGDPVVRYEDEDLPDGARPLYMMAGKGSLG